MSAFNNDVSVGIIGDGHFRNTLINSLLKENIVLNMPENQRHVKYEDQIHFCKSIAEIVLASNILITICHDSPELEEILFGEEGITKENMTGKVIIDMSSVSPEFIQELSEKFVEKEISFLDAVIINENQDSSGVIQFVLIGGEKSVYEDVFPIFDRIAINVKHIGVNGASQFYRQAFGVRKKR